MRIRPPIDAFRGSLDLLVLKTLSLERLDGFLLRAGLVEQLELETARAASGAEAAALSLDAREMILPGGMASHFQVLVQQKNFCRGPLS